MFFITLDLKYKMLGQNQEPIQDDLTHKSSNRRNHL